MNGDPFIVAACRPFRWGLENVIIRYTGRLAEAGIEPSVGSVGDSYGSVQPTPGGSDPMTGKIWYSRSKQTDSSPPQVRPY